ncbi:uncharacterized protein VICG_00864 [Vittaforma corneae ATCC 50505]|uniref:MYST-type HAT domain-containing protein n=1 Tax=Vittaforma corneae (strain ATCC 50505) TaxID=993615 RepID=L2GNX0_VITCO|nr:uncharacterized protein VICG_00864 [Vittaforma corneae ATCC 50505]ELA42017.1 hypothetical protein VICG_00864 [Vittaforma corneae ATCC 50505]
MAVVLANTTSPKLLNYGKHQIKPSFATVLYTVDGTLNVCSKCIAMFPTLHSLENHMERCTIPYKPIYEEDTFKVSKIEALKNKQLLSMISQMFIKSKTVYFEVDKYDFFIIYDQEIIGYFSRYKNGRHSLNCFLVFSCFQKQGWGTVLMDFSTIPAVRITSQGNNNDIKQASAKGDTVDLSNVVYDPKPPEKPYTKKAILCFRKYWKYKVIGAQTVAEISRKSNLTLDETVVGLELNGFNFKKWKIEGEIGVEKPRLLSKKVYKKSLAQN